MKRSALIVDDSSDVRMVVKAYLEEWPVEISEARNGTQALEQFRARPFDLVFVDLIMPLMDGPEVIQKLRSIEKECGRSPSYVVVVSGSADGKDWERAQQAGMNRQLEKPVALDDLEDLMTELGFEPT